ncbi:MAG: GGDEF domain-containing protein [Acidobacteriota bacterium]|nr:GGDEF domain-containing protein [Acidobacteriota bacterium]
MTAIAPRRSARRAFSTWLFLCVCAVALRGFAVERGLPLITVFPAEVHKAGPQSFDIAQDSRGVLYFGNLHGLLSYDGAWWRLRKLPNEQVALSLSADTRGNLALGLVNDFGYLDPATREYRSLLPQLPANQRHFGDVRSICSTAAGFLYVTEKSLLLWNGKSVRVAAGVPPDAMPRGCFAEGADVLLRGPKGVQRFDPHTLRITPTPITERTTLVMKRADGSIVAAVRDVGLFLLNGNTATPFAPAASQWLNGKFVTGGCRLRDGRLVITTSQHGVAILDAHGGLEQVIGTDAGLPDVVVNEPHVDREGSLWLAMEGPLVRIDLASPVTAFDTRRGLRGGASDVVRFNGTIYAATTHGLYTIDALGVAHRIEALQEGAARLLPVDDELLVGTAKGVYRVDKAGVLTHLIEKEGSIYDLFRSPTDPTRVWTAQEEGLGSIRRVDGIWRDEGAIAASQSDISSVVEKDGVLWAGTSFNGIVRVDDPRGAKPRTQTFGSGEMNVFVIGGRVIYVRASGEVVQLDEHGRFIPDPLLRNVKAPNGFFLLAQDTHGSLWINSAPPRMFERAANGQFGSEGKPLVGVTATDVQMIRVTDDGAIWFASDKGLFRYERGGESAQVEPQPAPLIRRAVAGTNRIVYDGTITRETLKLRHDFGRMRIEFAPLSYRPGVTYQYRLDPIDTHWSDWSSEPFVDYTTLAAHNYTFRVRARGPAMLPSREAQWAFAVLPPWYLSRSATALWIVLALAAIVGFIRIRTRTLRVQAERLRAKVADKTAELQQTVALLETANTQLEALSLEDDLTGIANRRSFERALTDEWNRARRREHPIALILLDLDHFKDLNDRRGHPAGDDCLRRVGSFLADTIRRSGEVVARYGGEEFAILLPAVEGDAAVRVAETLRAGIEHLGVPYGNGTGRRVTASCGVAAMVPNADLTAEGLVASADRALYAAKHSGRNCVRVADETTTGTWLRDVSA